ncbi:hypothetical protein FRC17_006913 [Serendipita sp. 399]|nr:hypothetical protein FRC17_006913 [Serendipita sp. 399]
MNPSQIYRRLAELPAFTSVSFASKHHIVIESSIRDHVNNTKRSFLQEASFSKDSSPVWLSCPNERPESIVARLVSASGTKVAILKEINGTPKKRFVEVWKGDQAELIMETTSRHGSFYGDATFSSLCFSPEENALLYTAEANPPEEDPKDPFKKFKFEQSYGETFIDRRRPTLFWLQWDSSRDALYRSKPAAKLLKVNAKISKTRKLGAFSHELEDPPVFALGQAVFASLTGRSVLATAYLRSSGDRKLGIVYCTNRASIIVRMTLPNLPTPRPEEGEETKANNGEKGKKSEEAVDIECHTVFSDYPARSPRVWFPRESDEVSNPVALWVSSAKEPHGSCSRLHAMALPAADELQSSWEGGDSEAQDQASTPPESTIVVDSVWDPSQSVEEGGFPGLYINQLPPNPFLFIRGKLYTVCVTSWGCYADIVAVPVKFNESNEPLKEQIIRLSRPGGRRATTVVNCNGRLSMAAISSDLTEPNDVFATDIGDSGLTDLSWQQVTTISHRVRNLTFELIKKIIDVKHRYPTQTIYLGIEDADRPLITMPHGGPHTVTPLSFSAPLVALVLCGYNVSLPNYTGSLGYGQRWVEALLGKIGSLDVEDVMASAKELVKRGMAKEGPGMQLYMGGSHGGFLGAHVVGQYPSFFSAAVLRNPVINIASMISTTDIPDWTDVECGRQYDPGALLTPESYSNLYALSPVQYVDKVQTPVLLNIGDVDQRVPPSQGKEYYHLLKARGMGDKAEMLWFPENSHALDKVEAERVSWEAAYAWFQRFGTKTV